MDRSQPHGAAQSGDSDDGGSSHSAPQDEPPQPTNQTLPTAAHDDLAPRVDITDAFALISHEVHVWLEDNAQRAMRANGATGELRVALLRDAEMTEAHERHCNAPGTTDVITFNLSDDDSGTELDVDVFVCVDEALRQANQRGITVERELLLYIVHAMLHCTGYNDKTEQDAAKMHEREDEILTAIGVGPVYYLPDNRERA